MENLCCETDQAENPGRLSQYSRQRRAYVTVKTKVELIASILKSPQWLSDVVAETDDGEAHTSASIQRVAEAA